MILCSWILIATKGSTFTNLTLVYSVMLQVSDSEALTEIPICQCANHVDVSVVLIEKWSPALQIRTVLLSIQALLSAPNPDDPLANDVAEQWKVNESQAIETGLYSI